MKDGAQDSEIFSGQTSPDEAPVTKVNAGIEAALWLEELYGVRLLSQEARLLCLIKRFPGRPLKFYLASSRLSQRWFSLTIEKLLKSGLIEKFSCEKDCRSKTLR